MESIDQNENDKTRRGIPICGDDGPTCGVVRKVEGKAAYRYTVYDLLYVIDTENQIYTVWEFLIHEHMYICAKSMPMPGYNKVKKIVRPSVKNRLWLDRRRTLKTRLANSAHRLECIFVNRSTACMSIPPIRVLHLHFLTDVPSDSTRNAR